MRHRKNTVKLGRTSEHRSALLAGLVCNLIAARRITTTLPKAKAARSLAERMVTLAKRNTLHTRRQAVSTLRRPEIVGTLFSAIGPAFQDRAGGYTRILKLGRRASDSSEMAILEWVNFVPKPPKKKVAKDSKGKEASGGATAAGKGKPAKEAEAHAKA